MLFRKEKPETVVEVEETLQLSPSEQTYKSSKPLEFLKKETPNEIIAESPEHPSEKTETVKEIQESPFTIIKKDENEESPFQTKMEPARFNFLFKQGIDLKLEEAELESMKEIYRKVMLRVTELSFLANCPDKDRTTEETQDINLKKDKYLNLANSILTVLKSGAPYGDIPAVTRLKEETDKQILEAAYSLNPQQMSQYLTSLQDRIALMREITRINQEISEVEN